MGNLKRKLAEFTVTTFRYREGRFFKRLRRSALGFLLKNMGRSVIVGPATFVTEPENIEIGNNVSIQQFCLISGYGGVKIGNDVSIAVGTKIFSSTHPYDNPGAKIREGKLIKKAVKIGDDVWIGANVIILPGVKIGSGVVVGAGSVVTKDLDDNCVYAGVPAKLIKRRF
ncbi:MAG: acyltransferase [Candidatus Woykebacteria bacterium]